MNIDFNQAAYWDRVAHQKTFTHPLQWDWLEAIPKECLILDYGCGYGRLGAEFQARGYQQFIGMDSSPEMIARGKQSHPGLDLRLNQGDAIPLPDGSASLLLLFAVLTCIPLDADQQKLIQELWRVLAPGGYLYLSEPLINPDARNQQRYAAYQQAPYGAFELPEGVVCRHHEERYLRQLLNPATFIHQQVFTVSSMNGNPLRVMQLFVQKAP